MTSPAPDIEIRELSRVYRVGDADVHALRGVSLQIAAGECLGVVGVSGSGKSTLLQLIGGLDTPTSGEIIVDGSRLGEMSARDRSFYRRSKAGFIFQSFYLVPSLTAEANVRLALTIQGCYGAERAERARQSLARVGLEQRRDHRPGQLSGGEQQRVAVARAVVNRPRLLLADEPTGNLDRNNAASLMDLIRGVQRETNMTVVIVTHDEELAQRYCDRIVRMRDGEVVGDETVETMS